MVNTRPKNKDTHPGYIDLPDRATHSPRTPRRRSPAKRKQAGLPTKTPDRQQAIQALALFEVGVLQREQAAAHARLNPLTFGHARSM